MNDNLPATPRLAARKVQVHALHHSLANQLVHA